MSNSGSSLITGKGLTPGDAAFRRVGIWVLAFAAAIVLLLVVGAVSVAVSGPNFASYQAKAIAACRSAVEAHLKAPSTAAFGGETATVQDEIPDEKVGAYNVTGWVEAENSFGAPVRTEWSCFSNVLDGEASAGRVRLD